MAFFKSLAGPGYVILNAVRVMNIIVLLTIAVACAVMLVKTSITTNFFVFDGANHVVFAAISLFLIVSELNIFRTWFSRYWPLLAQDSGLLTLGAIMVFLGMLLLGELNNEAMTEDSIGLPFWRIILGAGIVAIIFGVINIALNYIFRESDSGVTARHIRAHGAVATNKAAERKGSQHSFQLSGKASHPSFRSSSSTYSPHRAVSGSSRSGARFPVKISSPIAASGERGPMSPSTASPNIAIPDLAHHPAMYSDRV